MDLPVEFIAEIKNIVPDFEAFISSFDNKPSRAFRVNTLKVSDEALLGAMGKREAVPYAEHCYYLGEDEKWGNHPFHHAGLMYMQEPSAMATLSAFPVKGGIALDMCAAPGGKTIALSGMVDCLVSNEVNPARAATLKGNIERMGLKNVAVTNFFPSEIEKYGEIFDVVLLDVPCSGEGMFRKDETAVREWSEAHSISCVARQKAIIRSADKVLKRGGTLIYSTCTFSKRENEDVIDDFMSEFDYELVEPRGTVADFTAYLTDRRMRRFYPHLASGEGQFFAALTKRGGGESKPPKATKRASDKEVDTFLLDTIGKTLPYSEHNGIFYVPALPFELSGKVALGGVRIGRREGKVFKPDHNFFSAYGSEMYNFEPSEEELSRYLHGEELFGDRVGYGAITILGGAIGGFKGVDGRYKNLYPKGLRRNQ